MEETATIVTYILYIKIYFKVMLTSTRLNPGPGAYEPKTFTNPTGIYFISSVKNSKAPTFSLPSL